MNRSVILIITSIIMASCHGKQQNSDNNKISKSMVSDSTKQYGYNVSFLKRYTDVVELKKGSSALVIVPAWQARVMTSTSDGQKGFSFGWINHELISSRKTLPHINPFGGEERLWLGPEGGQFSIFFKEGDDFIYDNWQTPPFLDIEPFTVKSSSDTSAEFFHNVEIKNYSGTIFNLGIERIVSLMDSDKIENETGINLEGINFVGYRSENKLTNRGTNTWEKESGLLSIWMLGMFNPSPAVIVVIPVKPGDEDQLGPVVNDNYFGKIPQDRLKVSGNNVYFRADGKSRGKIGIPPKRAAGIMGSYDFDNNILTFLFCNLPEDINEYVNSAWEIQDNPYSGDALNSYNDGPLEDGSQMGPFYELETSSPAAALQPGQSIVHSQITIHLTGQKSLLNNVALKVLGVTLTEIENVFD